MKRIVAHLKENGLKYGFETLVVTVGILAAFGLNNWKEQRKSTNFEKELLIELRNSIISDYELMGWSIDGNNRSKHSCEIILSYFEQGLHYHDSLAIHFEYANTWWKMLLKENAYERAKAYGLDFIEDDSTRVKLSTLYENRLAFSRTLDDRQAMFHYNTVMPILIELFESVDHTWYIVNSEGTIPNDYATLRENKTYRSILRTNIGNRENYNEWIRITLSEMEEMEERLQTEIARLEGQ